MIAPQGIGNICITTASFLLQQWHPMNVIYSETPEKQPCDGSDLRNLVMDPKNAGGLGKGRAEWEGQNQHLVPLFLPTYGLLTALHKTSCFLTYRSGWYSRGSVRNNKQYCRITSKPLQNILILYEGLFWKYCKNICLFMAGWAQIISFLSVRNSQYGQALICSETWRKKKYLSFGALTYHLRTDYVFAYEVLMLIWFYLWVNRIIDIFIYMCF